ncbi:OLC1v1038994C1 [Oldenlandia corymbosa var. corymbosa]|uniref:OLC1v1038994C1 n=1 Tax=Oldenlandia corymbosa var. corymbosa TaxID=529605 RepID=A0AAV1D231_OLDCO|nr:OLC1v1038994C1 [Oldenlandia corymbosa var. corymbosa]
MADSNNALDQSFTPYIRWLRSRMLRDSLDAAFVQPLHQFNWSPLPSSQSSMPITNSCPPIDDRHHRHHRLQSLLPLINSDCQLVIAQIAAAADCFRQSWPHSSVSAVVLSADLLPSVRRHNCLLLSPFAVAADHHHRTFLPLAVIIGRSSS